MLGFPIADRVDAHAEKIGEIAIGSAQLAELLGLRGELWLIASGSADRFFRRWILRPLARALLETGVFAVLSAGRAFHLAYNHAGSYGIPNAGGTGVSLPHTPIIRLGRLRRHGRALVGVLRARSSRPPWPPEPAASSILAHGDPQRGCRSLDKHEST